jgi:hypothetical protein
VTQKLPTLQGREKGTGYFIVNAMRERGNASNLLSIHLLPQQLRNRLKNDWGSFVFSADMIISSQRSVRAGALIALAARSELGAKVFGVEHLADFDLCVLVIWVGTALDHSIASFDFTCHSQKPQISSFVSASGPSMTMRFLSRRVFGSPIGESSTASNRRVPCARIPLVMTLLRDGAGGSRQL